LCSFDLLVVLASSIGHERWTSCSVTEWYHDKHFSFFLIRLIFEMFYSNQNKKTKANLKNLFFYLTVDEPIRW